MITGFNFYPCQHCFSLIPQEPYGSYSPEERGDVQRGQIHCDFSILILNNSFPLASVIFCIIPTDE